MNQKQKPVPMLWLSDARGIYIPRDFAASFADRAASVAGVSEEAWKVLEAGPDADWYWDAWQEVCTDAIVTDQHGVRYRVGQDGDCWLIPEGMEWSDDAGWYRWPEEVDAD